MGQLHHHGGGGVGCCCELCGAPAAVHCAADAAFLCAACDARVHGANPLASRHHRTRLLLLAAAGSPAPDEDGYESAASSCVSTTDSPARTGSGRSPGARAEAVLEEWAKRTGLTASGSAARQRAAAAARAIRACAQDLASARVPPRVARHGRRTVAGGGGAG